MLIVLLLSVFSLCSSQKVSAQLLIVTYSPLIFNLSISQATALPKFQLLFNQVPIKYTISNYNSSSLSSYIIQGLTEGIVNPADYITQKYVLMFTEPLTIANGNLNLDSFLLRAKRSATDIKYILEPQVQQNSHYLYQSTMPALNIASLVIAFVVYFLAFTTLIGLNAYNFLAICVFINLSSPLYTALDYRIAYYLMFDIYEVGTNQILQFIYLLVPFFLIGFSFVVGIVSRWRLTKLSTRSGFCNYVFYYLSYKFFITSWGIMCMPLFANTAFLLSGRIALDQISPIFINFYIYFSVATIVFYSYMCFLTCNPQLHQTPNKWQKYILTSHFQMLDGFHLGIDAKDWKKRNYSFLVSLIRICIMIFVSVGIAGIPNLLFQITYLIYLFTLRPFKYDFFNYFNIGMEIFVIVFYLYRYIVELYMSISDEITTSTDITSILFANVIFLCVIILSFFVLGAYQFYQRLKSFRINVMNWDSEKMYAKDQQQIRKKRHSAFRRQTDADQNRKKGSPKKSSHKERQQRESKVSNFKEFNKQKIQKSPGPSKNNEQKFQSFSEKKKHFKTKEKSSLLQSINVSQESARN